MGDRISDGYFRCLVDVESIIFGSGELMFNEYLFYAMNRGDYCLSYMMADVWLLVD